MDLKSRPRYQITTAFVFLLLTLSFWNVGLAQARGQIEAESLAGLRNTGFANAVGVIEPVEPASAAGVDAYVPLSEQAPLLAQSQIVTSPLQSSGLTPLWQENFTNGSIDRMQFTWAKGYNFALTSFVMPGAVYLGKDGVTPFPWVEQEINNFKAYQGESLPNTLEFDVFSPFSKVGRLSLRPRRRADFAHMYIGYPNNRTSIQFSFKASQSTTINYNELTGPSYGWAHVTVSYRQYLSGTTTYAHYVIAINEEVREYTAPSGVTNPDWATHWSSSNWKGFPDADGWSIEHTSSEDVMGKYIANVRAYSGFLTAPQMKSRLQGRVTSYRVQLPDPRTYNGLKKSFQVHKDLVLYGPNALAYAQQIAPLQVKFDGSLSSSWGKIITYTWAFGDGSTGNGRIINHTYAQAGTYQATLTVSNRYGTESHQIPVTVADGSAIANLALTKTRLGSGDVMAGQPITYELTVTNTGPISKASATIVDSFNTAAALTAISGSDCTWAPGSGTVTCIVSNINKDSSKKVTLLVTTSNLFRGTLSNTALVQATDAFDNDPGDNSAGPVVVNVLENGNNSEVQSIYLPLLIKAAD
jgi:PKD repeat protein